MTARPMTDTQISRALRAHLPERAAAGLRERVFDAAETTAQLRSFPSFLGALSEADPLTRRRNLLVAAALLVALAFASAAAVGALRLLQRDPIHELSLEPPVDLPSTAPSPSGGPSASPSPTPTPILWTLARPEEDWPAPVRAEPDEGAIVVPILLKTVVEGSNCPADCSSTTIAGHHVDPSDDTGSDLHPWADIRLLEFCSFACLQIDLATSRPIPGADPTDQWMAYGVVADTDRDGVPDWRYGIDNMPVDATGEWGHRAWRTDLHTGRTESAAGAPYGLVGKTFFDTIYPVGSVSHAGLWFGSEVAGGGTMGGLPERFYAWASVIQDGRVVATDYAPDVGWLEPSPNAKP